MRLWSKKGLPPTLIPMVCLIIGSGVLLTLFGRSIYQMLEINAWSLNYLHAHMGHTQVSLTAPDQHLRASLWLARDALARDDPAQARVLVEDLAENGNSAALVILGDALAAEGEFAEAIEAWSQAGDILSLLDAAAAARDDGRLADALLAFRAAYTIDMEKGTLPLATFLWDADIDRNESVALIRDVLLQYPYSAQPGQRLAWFRQLGKYLQLQYRWDEAEATYQDLLKEYPQDWQAYVELGWVYYKRGDGLDAALLAFQKATAVDPSRGDGHYAMAQVLIQEKRYSEADTWFAQAVDLNPQQKWWWLTWGNVMIESGDLPRALNIYGQTVEKFPDWAPGYYEMAWAYRLADSKDRSIEAIEQALALVTPPSEWYYVRAGQIYEWADDKAEAIAAYREALIINPLNYYAQQGLHRLGQE